MIENGYVLMARQLLDSEVFASEKTLKIWIWILCKANHKKKFVPIKVGKGTITVKVERGQFVFGRNKASEQLFINGNTVYKIINKFKKMGMIQIESNNKYSIITVCNYITYQDPNSYKVTAEEQQSNSRVTAEEQQSNTNKNVKNVKNVNKNYMLADEKFAQVFDEFKRMRVKLKKPMTDYAVKLALNKLEKLSDGNISIAIEIINRSVENSWQGLFSLPNDYSIIGNNGYNDLDDKLNKQILSEEK